MKWIRNLGRKMPPLLPMPMPRIEDSPGRIPCPALWPVREGEGWRLGQSRLTRVGTVWVLRTGGSAYDMGFAHGRLLGRQVRDGTIDLFARMVSLLIESTPAKPLAPALTGYLRRTVVPRLAAKITPRTWAQAAGLADGSGLSLDTILLAYAAPETFLFAMGLLHRLVGTPLAPPAGTFGCTMAAALPDATAQGRLLVGRNFDYQGTGHWDRNPVVSLCRPTDGLPFITVTTAGFASGGISSVNEAGLCYAAHQHFITDLDLTGVPVCMSGDELMHQARNADEAVDILDQYPPVAAFTHIVGDGARGELVLYQAAPGHRSVQRLTSGTTAYTNCFLDPKLARLEVDLYPAFRRANHARLYRARELVRSQNDHTPQSMASLLGDHTDYHTREERVMGNTIANALTVASMVFDPGARRVYVADGEAPTSNRPYLPFSLDKDDGIDGGPPLEGHPYGRTPGLLAFELYRDAYRRQLERGDLDGALALMEQALVIRPDDSGLSACAGLLAARMGQLDHAVLRLRQAATQEDHGPRRASLRLHLARCLDLAARRPEALPLYHLVAHDPEADPAVRRGGYVGRYLPCPSLWARTLSVDLMYGDAI